MAIDIQKFLEIFLDERGLHRTHEKVLYVQFILSSDEADYSFKNVFSGKRSAMFRIKQWFTSQDMSIPEIGYIIVLTDYFGQAHAVVEITDIKTVTYKNFTQEMALAAGVEGGDLDVWRATRQAAIMADCEAMKIVFHEDIEIMAMWFDLLYPQ
ncbi:MAG: ASCH domain-containing protein [Alphaproteobacteria bacterium]|nr:ASCH domain-containing protein [Alphaproteobacteria bacterium]